MFITNDIKYVGVNDHDVDLFEGQYVVPNGMAYNSYVIMDEKVAVMDTVDARFKHEWLDKIGALLGDRQPDYLIIQHMEPDHSANIANFMQLYTETTIVSSAKAFTMMKQFFGTDFADRCIVIKEGDTLCLGKHTLAFVAAPSFLSGVYGEGERKWRFEISFSIFFPYIWFRYPRKGSLSESVFCNCCIDNDKCYCLFYICDCF